MTRADASELLSRMQAEDSPLFDAEQESEREERIVAHINASVANLTVQRHRQIARRRRLNTLLVAACLSLGIGAAMLIKRSDSNAVIAREPLTKVQSSREATVSPRTEVEMPSSPVQERERKGTTAPRPIRGEPSHVASTAAEPPPAVELPTPTASSSTLSEENRLFQAAAQAERAGENASALSLLDELVQKFPLSPLTQNAMARKFRLLGRMGSKSEAASAAKHYLRTYPQGFAQREAEDVVSGANTGTESPRLDGE